MSRWLKCTILITRCLRPSVVVNFSRFQLLLWNLWTEFNKLDRKQDHYVFYQFFFGADRKNNMPSKPLIGGDIFYFISETTEQNSMRLERKQDLNALYKVCVFSVRSENKIATPASDWLRHFLLHLWNLWTEFNETWQEARSQRPLPTLCFSGRSEK